MQRSATRYARSGDLHIAYQVVGDGPIDFVWIPGWLSHVDLFWELPAMVAVYERIASFARLIMFDKRGTGASDRVNTGPIEEQVDDLRAVLDAAGSEKAALFGYSEGGPLALLFAATFPERVSALVLYGTYARALRAPDYPCGIDEATLGYVRGIVENHWGEALLSPVWAPSAANDPEFKEFSGKLERIAASPGAALAELRLLAEIDVRAIVPTVRTPALVLHRTGDIAIPACHARWMAAHLPDGRLVELQGDDHLPMIGDTESLFGEIEEFLTGVRSAPEPDRVLATIMFTDIVGSTERAAAMGDAAWRTLLERHDTLVRRHVEQFRGREIKTLGDGFMVAFDGPARAVRCAQAATAAVRDLGIEVRAGVHTGECEVVGRDFGGIGVVIASRIAALAGPGEVLASGTVKDLVAGSGLEFEDRGARELKGVPGEWRIHSLASAGGQR